MMAIKPSFGISDAMTTHGTAGAEAGGEGDAFKAILATLADAAEGEGVAPAAPDQAQQMIAMVVGAVPGRKVAGIETVPGETVEGQPEAGATDEAAADTTGADIHAATILTAPPAAPAALQTSETATPTILQAGPQQPTDLQAPAAMAAPAPATPEAAAAAVPAPAAAEVALVDTPAQTSAARPVTAATSSPSLSPARDSIAAAVSIAAPVSIEAVAAAIPAASKKTVAEAEVKAPAQSVKSAQSVKPPVAQLIAPHLFGTTPGLAKTASQARTDVFAPTASETAAPASAPNFLVSTILPLLPESLHSLVLGQGAATGAAAVAEAPQALGAEQLIEQHLDLAHEGEWLDQLAKDIARSAGNEGGLRFRLNPENLGSLHVEMTQGPAGATIRMTADTEAARAIIAEAQPKLVAEARAQGLRIAESHVDLCGQQASGDPRRQGDLQQQQRFVRTAAAEPADASASTPRPQSAAERYA